MKRFYCKTCFKMKRVRKLPRNVDESRPKVYPCQNRKKRQILERAGICEKCSKKRARL